MTARREPTQIFLADVWQAMRTLRPDAAALAQIVAMLDVRGDARDAPRRRTSRPVSSAPPVPSHRQAGVESSSTEGGVETSVDVSETETRELASGQGPLGEAPEQIHRILPIRIEKVSEPPPKVGFGFVPEPVPPPTDEEHEPFSELLSLLDPAWTRALLTAAMSTIAFEGAIDHDALVDAIASGTIPAVLPRRLVASMRRGVHLLIDFGSGLVPFVRDRDAITRAIVRLAGIESVQEYRFRRGPWVGVYDVERAASVSYDLPSQGTGVVLVTDFGIGRATFTEDAAPVAEWTAFLDAAAKAGVQVVAFVPYTRDRWNAEIARRATLVSWDRRTKVIRVQSTGLRRPM